MKPDTNNIMDWLREVEGWPLSDAEKTAYGFGAADFHYMPRTTNQKRQIAVYSEIDPSFALSRYTKAVDHLPEITRNGWEIGMKEIFEKLQNSGEKLIMWYPMDELIAAWDALPNPKPIKHPMEILVAAYRRRPVVVQQETRADRRIMPKVVGPSQERERGMLMFGGLLDGRREADLPLFPEIPQHRLRVSLIEIYDATGAPVRSRGKGAPVEARLIIRGGFLAVRQQDRHLPVVRIAMTVQELLDGLYPSTPRRLRQHWPKIETALRSMHNFTVTFDGGRWFPMTLRHLPGPYGSIPTLQDRVLIEVALPPGAETGASVDLPYLDQQGLISGPVYFAYLAARSLVWIPGITRRRGAGRNGRRWGWSSNPQDYPVLSLADQRRLAFGDRDSKNRSKDTIMAPWTSLPDVEAIPDSVDRTGGAKGIRIIPAEAEAAVAAARRMHNRGV